MPKPTVKSKIVELSSSLKDTCVEKVASKIPVFEIEGDIVHKMNVEIEKTKKSAAVADSLKKTFVEIGTGLFFEQMYGDSPNPTSIVLKDETGESARYTFQKKYSNIPRSEKEAVEQAFASLGADAASYVEEAIAVEFDTKVFYTKDGTFDEELFIDFSDAVERAAKRRGIENPLSKSIVIRVKESFAEDRFKDFGVEDQKVLSSVLKNTVAVAVIPPDKGV